MIVCKSQETGRGIRPVFSAFEMSAAGLIDGGLIPIATSVSG